MGDESFRICIERARRKTLESFRICISTDDVGAVPPLVRTLLCGYEADIDAAHRIIVNLLHEAVEARAVGTAKHLLSHTYTQSYGFRSLDAGTFDFFWITVFGRVCYDEDVGGALLMFDLSPIEGWAGMSAADKIEELRRCVYPNDWSLDFYTPLVHLHAKIPIVKKILEQTRLRGVFRRWALNEELLADLYKPPTTETVGGTAFRREESAALAVLA